MNRIKDATETSITNGQSSSVQTWKQTFTYDRYGNRAFDEANTTTLPKNCGTSPSFTVCTSDRKVVNPTPNTSDNRLSAGDNYAYDYAGNTTADAQGRTFVYDAENKQTLVSNSSGTLGEYLYDGDGKRVKKVSAAEETIFVYDASGKMIAEYSTALNPTPQVSYLTSDHLGSPRINTDEKGNVISRHDYQPFGEEINQGRNTQLSYKGDAVRKQFTSYERDNETDLDFAQARYHSSARGRFTSADAFSGNRRNPQSLNKYSYVLNSPLKFNDPSGHTWENPTEKRKGKSDWFEGKQFDCRCFKEWINQGGTPVWIDHKEYEKNPSSYTLWTQMTYGSANGQVTLDPKGPSATNSCGWSLNGTPCVFSTTAPPVVTAVTGSIDVPSNLHLWNSNLQDPFKRFLDLKRHFGDHGADFGAETPGEYNQMSRDFGKLSQEKGPNWGYETKVDADGVIGIYDPQTNTYGAYNPDTTTRTFMKPTREDYFNDEPGFAPEDPIIFDDVIIEPLIIP